MTTCLTDVCGTGDWNGPLPGDPDNNSVLTVTPAFGGIDVAWSYPATNPHALAHTLVYRGLSNDFNAAMQIAVASGSQYYDKIELEQIREYFYWIRFVSINGTVGALIGPASTTAKPTIDQMIELLSGRINSGVLAQSLKTEIDRIVLLDSDLQGEISERVAANLAISQAIGLVQADMDATLAAISQEIAERQEGESALVGEINAAASAIVAESTTRALAIQNEATARATALLNEAAARASELSALQSQINTLQAASSGDLSDLLAVLQTEQTARAAADIAESTSRETLATQVRGAYQGTDPAQLSAGLLYTERQSRITANEAIVSSVSALSATVGQNTADITAETTARSTADTALTNSFSALNSQVNNATTGLPATRSSLINNYYTKTTVDNAIAAAVLNLVSTTGLNNSLANYTTTASLAQNYYTKTQTDSAISSATTTLNSSINTTLSSYVTNANLTTNYYTKTAADSAISFATQNLVSTTALNTALASYPTTATLNTDYYTKTATNSAISAANTTLQSSINTTLGSYATTASLTANYYTKTATDSAISTATSALSSSFSGTLSGYVPTATLTTNYYTKTQADGAISAATQNLVSTTALNTALTSYPTTATLSNNYYTKTQADTAISAATQNLVSNTGLNTALGGYVTNSTLSNNYYTKTQADTAIATATSTLVSNAGLNAALGSYTTTSALQNAYYTRAQTDSAISSASTTTQTILNNNISSAQTALQTNINTVNGKVTAIGALYTAKVSVNGLIGGFGIYNDGSTIQAGFDVNEFWIGSSQANKRKPFIISGGVTYIDDAAINKLTFTKLRDESGSVLIENGKIKADYLSVTKITGGSFTGYAWPASGTGFYIGPGGLLMGNYNTNRYIQITESGDLYAPGFSIVNSAITFSGQVISSNNLYNESVNIFKLARGASLPDYVRTYKGSTTPTVPVNSWMPLQLDAQALNNRLSANDYDAYRVLLPAGTYFYELSVPVKCQGSDTNDACYTAIISNPPGGVSGTYQTVCGNVWVGDYKSGYYEYQCWQEYVPANYTVLSTAGVNVVGDWQTATIFGVGRFTLATPTYISAAVMTTDGSPALNVVARSGYSTTILRIWRDNNV